MIFQLFRKCFAVVRNGYTDFFFVCVLCIGQVVDLAISGRTGLDLISLAVMGFPFFSLDESAMFSPLFHFSYCGIRLRNWLSAILILSQLFDSVFLLIRSEQGEENRKYIIKLS